MILLRPMGAHSTPGKKDSHLRDTSALLRYLVVEVPI